VFARLHEFGTGYFKWSHKFGFDPTTLERCLLHLDNFHWPMAWIPLRSYRYVPCELSEQSHIGKLKKEYDTEGDRSIRLL
jgi:hypothetical protein